MGCRAWPAVGWYQASVIGWSKYRLGLPQSQCIAGSCDWWEFPPFFRGHWQYPCKDLIAWCYGCTRRLWKSLVETWICQLQTNRPTDCWPLSYLKHYLSNGCNIISVLFDMIHPIEMILIFLKRKDHHGVSSGWSSVWHRSNTGLSCTQYDQIPIILGVWPFCLTPFFFSANNILAGLWLNCISSVEITLFLLADILLPHRAVFEC